MLKEQCMYWPNMKFDHNKHEVEQLTSDCKVLWKMTGMSHKQVLEHFKEAFPPKIEAESLKVGDTDIAIGKARVPVLVFK